jgi:pimeloyl-ACP methyl ester carboxylesterase
MSHFGLIHGAGLGAWCWEQVISELAARGHEATAVDLPLNDPTTGASGFTDMVLEAFAGVHDLLLVGHSISGLIIPIVAARRPVGG